MNDNPYVAPASEALDDPEAGRSGQVARAVVDQLRRTQPWVRFLAVLLFVGTGLMLALGFVVMIAGALGANLTDEAAFGGPAAIAVGAVYALLALLYLFPALKLWSYASRIATLADTRREPDLIAALDAQRAFWKLLGVLAIAVLALYALGLVGALVVSVLFRGM